MSITRTIVMAVPWEQLRVRRAVALAREADAEILWDRDHDAFHTWRDVLTAAGTSPVVVLEDDIRLARDWRSRVEDAITAHPDHVIQFFSLRHDAELGSRWMPGRTYLMNQCHYLPRHAARRLLTYTTDWQATHPEDRTGMDTAIAHWLRTTGQQYWLHVPSLVQHEPWRSEIHAKRPRTRQSPTFT